MEIQLVDTMLFQSKDNWCGCYPPCKIESYSSLLRETGCNLYFWWRTFTQTKIQRYAQVKSVSSTKRNLCWTVSLARRLSSATAKDLPCCLHRGQIYGCHWRWVKQYWHARPMDFGPGIRKMVLTANHKLGEFQEQKVPNCISNQWQPSGYLWWLSQRVWTR